MLALVLMLVLTLVLALVLVLLLAPVLVLAQWWNWHGWWRVMVLLSLLLMKCPLGCGRWTSLAGQGLGCVCTSARARGDE